MHLISAKITCPVCGELAEWFFTKNGYDIYRCRCCLHMFVFPLSNVSFEIYDQGYFFGEGDFVYGDYDGDKDVLSCNFNKYLKKINQFVKLRGKLFDVGAATGIFIELANSQGWCASGIELSADASLAGKKRGLGIIKGNFESLDIEMTDFTVVTFWDVLEHFINPEIAIINAGNMLKVGGLLAINTPNVGSVVARILGRKWHLIGPPEHLHYFSLNSLKLLLERNNFELLYTGYIGKRFSLRYVFKTLAHWQKCFVWNSIYSYLKNNQIGKLNFPIDTFDNMFIVARKVCKPKE